MLPAHKITSIAIGLILGNLVPTPAAETISFQIPAPKAPGGHVTFDARIPEDPASDPRPILILVPGYNGSGRAWLTGFWADFADRTGTILLAPTFQTTLEEIHSRTGYYYPALWSGDALLRAVEKIATLTPTDTDKLFFYGHSAGAHFTHRFALWRPDRVAAFVAYSAAWWDPPDAGIRSVPALIMCGEDDPRYEATLEFYLASKPFEAPWVWRGFRHTGHESTRLILFGSAVALLDPNSTVSITLVCPTPLDSPAAHTLLASGQIQAIHLAQIDEDRRGQFWREIAPPELIHEIPGVGNRIDWAWSELATELIPPTD